MVIKLLLCFLLFTAPAAAQSVLRGVVKDTRGALVSATVVLMRADSSIAKTVRTGKGGVFTIDAVPDGRYILSARFLGYQPYYICKPAYTKLNRPIFSWLRRILR